MKLYKVPKNSKIRIIDKDVTIPPSSLPQKEGDVLDFSHCDGMYSYCTDKDGNVIHISRMTEVEVVSNIEQHETAKK